MSLYLRNIYKFLEKKKWSITLITSDKAIESPTFKIIEKETGDNLQYQTINFIKPPNSFRNPIAIFIYQVRWWFRIRMCYKKLCQNNNFDCVYVPSIDFMIHALTVLKSPFGNTPLFGTLISSKNHLDHNPRDNKFKTKIKKSFYKHLINRFLSLNCLVKLFVIDPDIKPGLQGVKFKYVQKIEYLPDFADAPNSLLKKDAREILGLEQSDFIILAYGSLSRRKGIINLLKSCRDFDIFKNIKIIVAGVPDHEFLKEFNELIDGDTFLKKIVIQQLFFHDDRHQNIVFKAADCIWLGYTNGFSASSGVLFQSIAYGIPSIATKEGLIGDFVKNNNTGLTCNADKPRSINMAIKNLHNEIKNRKYYDMTESLKFLSHKHSPKEHMTKFIKHIETFKMYN